MWHARAQKVDVAARWTIPTGFACFIGILYQMGEENLERLSVDETTRQWQFAFYISGLVPVMCAACVRVIVLGLGNCPCCNHEAPVAHHDSHRDDGESSAARAAVPHAPPARHLLRMGARAPTAQLTL